MTNEITLGEAVRPNVHEDELGELGQKLSALANDLDQRLPRDTVLSTISPANLWRRVDGRIQQFLAEEAFRSTHRDALEVLRKQAGLLV